MGRLVRFYSVSPSGSSFFMSPTRDATLRKHPENQQRMKPKSGIWRCKFRRPFRAPAWIVHGATYPMFLLLMLSAEKKGLSSSDAKASRCVVGFITFQTCERKSHNSPKAKKIIQTQKIRRRLSILRKTLWNQKLDRKCCNTTAYCTLSILLKVTGNRTDSVLQEIEDGSWP